MAWRIRIPSRVVDLLRRKKQVGGGLLAVVLGPWAAMVCVTIALAIQALLFGDGGIWTFTANCFNMALVLPFIVYGVYRLISGQSELSAKRRWIGAAVDHESGGVTP